MTEGETEVRVAADRPESVSRGPSVIGRVLGFLLRLIFVVLLGVGLGALAYFGVPALYRSFVEPVEENSRRIERLEVAQARELEATQLRAERLGEGLASLEDRLAEQVDALAELQVSVEALQTETRSQEARLSDLDRLRDGLEDLESSFEITGESLAELESAVFDSAAPTQRLARQLQLVRAMELLTRARLGLVQGNLGLAAEDVEAAREGLARLLQASPEEETEVLTPIIERLDLALEDIRTAPDLAEADLEVAWQLMLEATALPEVAP